MQVVYYIHCPFPRLCSGVFRCCDRGHGNDGDDCIRSPRVYDLVTTSVYLPKDSLALTLNGLTRWPTAKELGRLEETQAGGTPAKIRRIMRASRKRFRRPPEKSSPYAKEHPQFADIGQRMLQEWESGVNTALRGWSHQELTRDASPKTNGARGGN